MATFRSAIDAFNERIKAVQEERIGDDDLGLCGVTDNGAKLLLSGFDLDADEIMEYSERITSIMLALAVRTRLPVHETVAGMWFQGFMVGLLYADLLSKEKAAS